MRKEFIKAQNEYISSKAKQENIHSLQYGRPVLRTTLSLKIANEDGKAKQKHTRGQKISGSKKTEQSRAWSRLLLGDTELCD